LAVTDDTDPSLFWWCFDTNECTPVASLFRTKLAEEELTIFRSLQTDNR
jgi:hypothetical protein